MRSKSMNRFISVALSVSLLLGALGLSPISVAAAAAPTSITANYNQFQVKLTADPVTDTVPADFGTAGSAGRIWTDKSVMADSDGSFGVTLSALAQEYMTTDSSNPGVGGGSSNGPAADVTFILDMSSSMGSSSGKEIAPAAGEDGIYYRVEAMAMAANDAIRTVMNANPNNRVGVYWFGGSASSNHLGTFLELGHYELTSGHETEDYLKYNNFTVTPNSNLTKDGASIGTPTTVSLGGGTPTQDGIMYGISKTLKNLGTMDTGPKRKPYVFVLSDGAAIHAKKAWYTSPKGISFESDFDDAIVDATTIANYNQSGTDGTKYVPATASTSLASTGDPEIAALTILTGAYMKKLIDDKYTVYNNGEATEAKVYTVGLGSTTAINGPYVNRGTESPVYAWAGLDPQTVYDKRTDTTFRNGSAVNTYDKITNTDGTGYADSGPSSADFTNAFVYSNFYTFASSYDVVSSAFNGLANDVEATTTILPLIEIPESGSLGGSDTADMDSAIVFVDEIGNDFNVDLSTLQIGGTVATVDSSITISDGTAYQFAGYGSKAVIKTIAGVTSLIWYIEAEDMQPHIFRFTNRTSPVEGQYTAPTNGAFTLQYKVKPAFSGSPDNVTETAYYLNSGNTVDGAKTAAYFAPPTDSPYYTALSETQTIDKTDGIGAPYVTEESKSDGKVTMKLGNNGKLDLVAGIVKSGPATVQINGSIDYTVTIYNYTDTDITGLSVTSEGQTQTDVDVPANSSKDLTFSITAPSEPDTVTSGAAEISAIGLTSNTVTTNVTDAPPNTLPTVADFTKNGTTDTVVSFAATDFSGNFFDGDHDALDKVIVTSLPANGTLELNGVEVTVNQEISAADLDKLTFVPEANWYGSTSFNWNGSDGTSYAEADATVTIVIAALNGKPTVADFTKNGTTDTVVSFAATDFSDKFADSDLDSLDKVKVTSLPAHGTLELNGVAVTADQEIPAADLDKLTFTPNAGWNGTTTFGWNGSDGTSYAEEDATVTIVIAALNGKPTVADFTKNGTTDTVVSFAATDFSGNFIDGDLDALDKVKVTSLPAHGTLELNGVAVTANQEIPVADLDKLTFTPEANWNGSTTFDWNGTDGTSYAEADATVKIVIAAANGKPTVSDVSKSTDGSDVLFTTTDFSSKFTDGDHDALDKVKVTSLPTNGTLKLNGIAVTVNQEIPAADLDKLTFVPDANWNGTASFGWNGSDGEEYAEVGAKVNITVQQLEGWVGSRGYEVTSPLWVSAPGNPLKLSAITPEAIGKVTATFDFEGGSAPVELTKVGSPSNGLQRWEATTYLLPYTVPTGEYHATFIAYIETAPNEWWPELTEPASKLANNGFKVMKLINVSGNIYDDEEGPGAPIAGAKVTLYDPTGTVKVAETSTDAEGNYSFPNVNTKQYLIVVEKQGYGTQKRAVNTLPADPDATVITQDFALVEYNLQLTASPSSIVGDGNSRSLLKAVLRNGSGVELANVPILFSAGAGTFEKLPGDTSSTQANTVLTNESGEAYIYYKSGLIEGIISQQIPVSATADDSQRSLYAQEQIIVTFEPASVNGVIKLDGVEQAGATVRIIKDFNGDGVIDFAAETVTDKNGKYSIAVPRGDVDYILQVTNSVVIDGVPTQVTFEQKANVGSITGIGANYDSNQTVSGVIALKPSDGGSYIIDNNSELRNAIKVYLKNKTTNEYVGGNATPTAFTLDNGVFNAEIPAGEYELEVRFVVPDAADPDNHALDKEIIINALDDAGTLPVVTVTATGELNIVSELIDPYGHVTDKWTGMPIEGATVTLYYANTQRNADAVGKTPGTPVTLPKLVGFDPNDNESPNQLTDINGLYAYMVYPETDYYVVVSKAGYYPYTSPILSVEWEIVKHDVALVPVVASGGVPVNPEVSLAVSTDQNVVQEGTQSTITVDYKNISTAMLNAGTITVQLPDGVEVIDANGGTVNGNTISWNVTNLPGGQSGSYKIKVQWSQLDAAEKEFSISGEFGITGSSASGAKANSTAKIKVFSDRFGNLSHQRYIIGMPDGEFKLGNSLTRAELAAIVARLTENETIDYALPFSDIRKGHWATNYIRIAVKHGYFGGFSDGTFRPDEAITRGELAAVMARFLDLNPSKPVSNHFSDTKGNWAENAIEALYLGNYLTGYTDGMFRPNQKIRRDEAVTMINRMLYRGPLQGLDPVFPDVPTTNWAFGEVQEATVSHEAVRNSDGSETFVKRIEDDVQ